MTLWSYKISRDFGFAPNPFFGICTLATCKPQIRQYARSGDIIVGCGCSSNNLQEHIIFAMEVREVLNYQDYWDGVHYSKKKPAFHSGYARAYGDNIYHTDENQIWLQEESHHSLPDGELNKDNYDRDLSSKNVLIGSNFIYWGGDAIHIPAIFRNLDGDDIYPRGRNYRNSFSPTFEHAFRAWFNTQPKRGRLGRPDEWP